MAKYVPGRRLTDSGYIAAYAVSDTMLKVLKQCNGDFSRENMMKQATNIHKEVNPVLLPGITISISPTNYHPIKAMQLAKWDGKTWVRFGEVIEGVQT